MEEEKKVRLEDIKEEVVPTSETTEETTEESQVDETTQEETEQNLLKIELDRVKNNKVGRTELEKASFTLKKTAERVKELGGDPAFALGVNNKAKNENIDDDIEEDEDNKPLTIGMFKKIQQQNVVETAINLAEEIPDEIEKELVKHHLENTIKTTGNPKEDLRLARALVNSVKNVQIQEQKNIKPIAKNHSSGSSAPAKVNETSQELTAEELMYTRPPFNLPKDKILALRKS
jgi:hypothetical protein